MKKGNLGDIISEAGQDSVGDSVDSVGSGESRLFLEPAAAYTCSSSEPGNPVSSIGENSQASPTWCHLEHLEHLASLVLLHLAAHSVILPRIWSGGKSHTGLLPPQAIVKTTPEYSLVFSGKKKPSENPSSEL